MSYARMSGTTAPRLPRRSRAVTALDADPDAPVPAWKRVLQEIPTALRALSYVAFGAVGLLELVVVIAGGALVVTYSGLFLLLLSFGSEGKPPD